MQSSLRAAQGQCATVADLSVIIGERPRGVTPLRMVCTAVTGAKGRRDDMTQRNAEIVGAGFAGLTAACALAQRGWRVRVHERGDKLRTTGAGIYVYENGLRVLEAVGAYEAAVANAPMAHTREVRDDRNRVISVHRWKGSRVFSIVRQNVINALAGAATGAGAEIV